MDKNLIDNQPTTPIAALSDVESQPYAPEMVNHPSHYNNYDIEVIDMMEKIWGTAYLYIWCIVCEWEQNLAEALKKI